MAERTLLPALRTFARGGAVDASVLARSARFVADDGLRLDLAWPEGPAPEGGFPLLVVTDANAMFATLVETARLQALRPDVTGLGEPVVLGIGHDIPGLFDMALRERDYTPPGADRLLGRLDGLMGDLGAHLPLSRERRVLIGHSLGGLFALLALFRRPDLFTAYVAASPSIWWDREAVRAGAEALPARLTRPVRLLLTAGGGERGSPPDATVEPAQARRLAERRVVEEAQALAARLAEAAPARLKVTTHIFEGESHGSVIPGALGRAARFAFED
ncbi:alpha/beta hydrolase [Aquabacter cavernae]|uniref:alpha/beta hydrolase n=1 Tax=Aquabacter cavernae TaxID=2496029 RepID=UPI00237C5600|nr:alpha/beta hydrolase-fold protein [Aquabacter cavernae]